MKRSINPGQDHMAESGRSEMGLKRPLTTQSGRSRDRRNGDECSLPDDFNTRLADSCTAQRYSRYVPIGDMQMAGNRHSGVIPLITARSVQPAVGAVVGQDNSNLH